MKRWVAAAARALEVPLYSYHLRAQRHAVHRRVRLGELGGYDHEGGVGARFKLLCRLTGYDNKRAIAFPALC